MGVVDMKDENGEMVKRDYWFCAFVQNVNIVRYPFNAHNHLHKWLN